ncbi:hypothetical protein BRE01_00570 [Brevibacillus reuszeri]|uniref:Uncharacterized protein n=1 Tax=Brevibacillus reuszeri TaxID=54915 RepID=A0A0K9YRM5_9BACL|nr:hypothetical protein [Brevibacillus reuszeri]KNB71363.1 hypothetical protein ADS79_21415 [Brevibacillus reuszeri]MED1857814.1 hypothetical protein [Brevibacillus reuszeri]GED66355.1 hypothetical protein BRE01_00570 [Brevibacillus reuszeri]
MEIQQHARLLSILTGDFEKQQATITFTQWDTDSEDDEEVAEFRGQLVGVKLTENEFDEKDLLLLFADEENETVEILMEIPGEEVDLATYNEGRLQIFGTEAEIVLAK